MSDGAGAGGAYDFFVSYTQADRAWAEWIAWDLEETGHRVLVQAWDFVPGSNWVSRMQDGVRNAERTIAVLSPAYLSSVYAAAEWQAAWTADPAGERSKLLVVRVTECERPGLLSTVVSRDLFEVTEAEARARLRRLVHEALTGRAKPPVPPGFPPSSRAVQVRPRFPTSLPRVWRVPTRNPKFTGRAEELALLEAGFRASRAVAVHSLHGMGGVGKTQLAAEYAHMHASDYDLVWWVDAEQDALIPDQFRTLAAKLDLPVPVDPVEVRDAVHEALRQVPGWLLVYDNAEDPDVLAPWLPSGPFPPGFPAHVLVTTRRAGYAAWGEVVDLDVMSPAEAVELLGRRASTLARDPQTAGAIAAVLGFLPLALDQAAAYLDRTGLPPGEWLRLWQTRSVALHDRGHAAFHRDTIATLWSLSLERLQASNPAAVQLIGMCAYLAPEPIPLDLFTGHPEVLPEPLRQAASDPIAFAETVAALTDYSLVKRGPDTVQVHRLVQDVIRARANPQPTP